MTRPVNIRTNYIDYLESSKVAQLVENFKKDPAKRAEQDPYWTKYKKQAMIQFRDDLLLYFDSDTDWMSDHEVIVIPMPTSRTKSHDYYDDRLCRVCKSVCKTVDELNYLDCFESIEDYQASHKGGTRNVQEIMQNTRIMPTAHNRILGAGTVVLVDDVLTTGSHYRACKELLSEINPDLRVIGLFWARQDSPDFDPLDWTQVISSFKQRS